MTTTAHTVIWEPASQRHASEQRSAVKRLPALKWYPKMDQWIADPNGSDNRCFNYPIALRLEGALHAECLINALAEIVRRHVIFRSLFELQGSKIVQMILEDIPLPFLSIDLQSVPAEEEEKESAVLKSCAAEAHRPIDLRIEPMLRVTLFKLSEQEHLLLVITHHLACDDWSINILLSELAQLYSGYVAGITSPLPPVRFSYTDFAGNYQSQKQGPAFKSQVDFWEEQLHGWASQPIEADFDRLDAQKREGRHLVKTFPHSLVLDVKQFSHANGFSPFMVYAAAFLLILARRTASEDTGIGICVANRNEPEIEQIVGPFSNRLLLRTQARENLSVCEFLSCVSDASWAVYAFQEIPQGELLDSLCPGSEQGSPLFHSLLVLENAPKHEWHFDGLEVNRVNFDAGTACYDLHIWINDQNGLRLAIQYDSTLFLPHTVESLMDQFHHILHAFITNPGSKLRDLAF